MSKFDRSKKILKNGYFVNLPILNHAFDPELLLWRSVIDLALVDLLRGREQFKNDYNKPRKQDFLEQEVPLSVTASCFMGPIDWENLIEWFNPSDEDFNTVCELAALPTQRVYEKMTSIINDTN